MHGESPVRELFYGVDSGNLFVRLDGYAKKDGDGEFKIEFDTGVADTKVARRRIVELSALRTGSRFRILILREGLPPITIPAEGWIELPKSA